MAATDTSPDFAALDAVPGLMWTSACRILHGHAAKVPADQAIVELGVYRGRTACWLAAGARSGLGAHVWAFDLWDTRPDRPRLRHGQAAQDAQTRLDAQRHVADLGLSGQVTLVCDASAAAGQAWAGPRVGLLFVDADHSEAGVRADVLAWAPHLTRDATILFDDYRRQWSGVRAAVTRLVDECLLIAPTLQAGRLAVSGLAR